MQIGIFVVMAGRNAGGPETYEHSLVRNMAELDQTNEYCILCLSQQAANSFRLSRPNFRYRVLWPKSRILSMSLGLPWVLKKEGVELLHAAYVAPPFVPVNYLFTLHCSSTFIHPEFYPPTVRLRLNSLINNAIKYAKHIICVSQHVMESVIEHYGISQERMSVVHNGIGKNFRPVESSEYSRILSRYDIKDDYMLFVGRFEPRKNITRILEAFNIYRHEVDNKTKLVLAGNKTWSRKEVDETISRLDLASHILEIGHVDNDDLPALYSGTKAFIFPSLWEGFGIPVIEAMACGAPVLTSNLSALPEIAGNAALLVDPYSVTDIAAGMQRIVGETSLRSQLRQRGLVRAQEFSWQKTAQETFTVYNKLVTEKA